MDRPSGHRKNNPSFSSTLLDAIYRSIDNEGNRDDDKVTMNTNNCSRVACMKDEEDMASFRRACYAVDKKVVNENFVMRRKTSMAELDAKLRDESMMSKSSSSSSDSSSAGGFSSSESESIYCSSNKSSKSSCYSMQMPKPIRTSISSNNRDQKYLQSYERSNYASAHQKHKRENGFVKTKSKALKMYSELKRVKQHHPISPGGKLASFLNSIFTAGNPKKGKTASTTATRFDDSSSEIKSKSGYESTCSSASSFSRSCLSKTPASSKGSISTKRSVRFCPVILDENHHVHKSLYDDSKKEYIGEELKFHAVEESRRVGEAARALLKKYQMMKDGMDNLESDEDDAASCASSDLFELDHLSSIGVDQRHRQELPVYETTHLDRTNLAFASGFMV